MKTFKTLRATVRDLLIDINYLEEMIGQVESVGIVPYRLREKMDMDLEEVVARMRSSISAIGSVALADVSVKDIENYLTEIRKYENIKNMA